MSSSIKDGVESKATWSRNSKIYSVTLRQKKFDDEFDKDDDDDD
jgi:hypothetical protein